MKVLILLAVLCLPAMAFAQTVSVKLPDGSLRLCAQREGFIDCSEPATESPELTRAVAALRTLNDAASVGVSLSSYREKLAAAKAPVEDALKALPDGESKKALRRCWQLHLSAQITWETMLTIKRLPMTDVEVKELQKELPKLKPANSGFVSREELLSARWLEASDILQALLSPKQK